MLSNALKGITWSREHDLRNCLQDEEQRLFWRLADAEDMRQRFINEEATKPRDEQRFWSDDPEGWPERYRRELEERGELASDEEARRWLEKFDRTYPKSAVEHFVEVIDFSTDI